MKTLENTNLKTINLFLLELVNMYNDGDLSLQEFLECILYNLEKHYPEIFESNTAVRENLIKFLISKLHGTKMELVDGYTPIKENILTIHSTICFDDEIWRLGYSPNTFKTGLKKPYTPIIINNFIISSNNTIKEFNQTGYTFYELDEKGIARKSIVNGDILTEFVKTPSDKYTKNSYKFNRIYDCETLINYLLSEGHELSRDEMEKLIWSFQPIQNFTRVEDLEEISEKGNRETNQDRTLIAKNKINSDLKLLAVADGMGGAINGEYAAQETINQLKDWFEKLEPSTINSIKLLAKELSKKIAEINTAINEYSNDLRRRFGHDAYTGTTLTLAIINEYNTLIANVGDSRCYILKDNILKQITIDDSVVWGYYRNGMLTKEEARIHIENNLITDSIGTYSQCHPKIYNLINKDYEYLLLLTDGVTDCLSDEKIRIIALTSKRGKILENIIQEALYRNQPKVQIFNYNMEHYLEEPEPGKDNASGVCYKKTFKLNKN